MAQNSTAIQVLDVTKTYTKAGNDVTPLERANLSVTSGEFVVMKGPSGSGKSTLLNLVAGIDKPSSGRVVVSGEDITDFTEDELAGWRSRAIGYVFQQFNLMPILTAYENVELPLLLMPLNAAQRRKLVETALEPERTFLMLLVTGISTPLVSSLTRKSVMNKRMLLR